MILTNPDQSVPKKRGVPSGITLRISARIHCSAVACGSFSARRPINFRSGESEARRGGSRKFGLSAMVLAQRDLKQFHAQLAPDREDLTCVIDRLAGE